MNWLSQLNGILFLCHTLNKIAKEVYSLLLFCQGLISKTGFCSYVIHQTKWQKKVYSLLMICRQFCCKRGLIFVIDLQGLAQPGPGSTNMPYDRVQHSLGQAVPICLMAGSSTAWAWHKFWEFLDLKTQNFTLKSQEFGGFFNQIYIFDCLGRN